MNRHRIAYEDGRSRYDTLATICANEWKGLVNPVDITSYLTTGGCCIHRGRVGENRTRNIRHAHSAPVGRDRMSHSSIIVYPSRPHQKEITELGRLSGMRHVLPSGKPVWCEEPRQAMIPRSSGRCFTAESLYTRSRLPYHAHVSDCTPDVVRPA